MSFTENLRQFWLKAAGEQCQFMYYDEKRGWQRCKARKKLHVHHIKPEGVTLHEGGNPDESEALVACENHHVRNISDEEHSVDFAFHPDMGHAYREYPEWKRQNEHMAVISGRREKKLSPSPFEEAANDHRLKAQRGERYHAGTPEIDEYYKEIASSTAIKYMVETGEKKPVTHRKVPYKPLPTNWEWTRDLFDNKNGK